MKDKVFREHGPDAFLGASSKVGPMESIYRRRMRQKCWFRGIKEHECDGPLDRAHLIPKQRMRIKNLPDEVVWDKRCWVWACRRSHTMFDHIGIDLKRSQLPDGVEEFALEYGLGWSLDRDYGRLSAERQQQIEDSWAEKLWAENDARLDEPCEKCGVPTILDGVIQSTRLKTESGWVCGECGE